MQIKDLSWLDETVFWRMMEHNQWVHPYDANGARRDYSRLPDTLTKLKDDPYRSLAGEIRTAGGYANSASPCGPIICAHALALLPFARILLVRSIRR